MLFRTVVALLLGEKVDADILSTNWQEIVKIAEKNGVHVPVAQKLSELPQPPVDLQNFCHKVKLEFASFWETVGNIQDILADNGIETSLIKTLKTYDYYDWDIDIVIHKQDWPGIVNLLAPGGWHIVRPSNWYRASIFLERKDKFQLKSACPGIPVIHVQRGVVWLGVEYIPYDVLWPHTVSQTFLGREYRVPDPTIDLLICSAHALFEMFELSLGEVYHLARALETKSVDMELATEIAQRNHWLKGLKLVTETVTNLSQSLSNIESLPYYYSLGQLWPVWLERAKSQLKRPKDIPKSIIEVGHVGFYMGKRVGL